jgi:hypothetical protein
MDLPTSTLPRCECGERMCMTMNNDLVCEACGYIQLPAYLHKTYGKEKVNVTQSVREVNKTLPKGGDDYGTNKM